MISLLCLEFRSFLIFSSSFVVFSCKILFTVASPSSAILIISKKKTSSKLLSENIWAWIIWASVCSNVCNGVCNLSDNTGWLRRRVKRGLVHQIHLYGLLTYLCFLCTSMFSYVLVIVQYFFLYRKYHTMIDDIILHLSCHKHPFVLIRVFIYGSSTFCSFKCLENHSICRGVW